MIKQTLTILTIAFISAHADFYEGETTQSMFQGVENKFINSTEIDFADINDCSHPNTKSIVYTSKINNMKINTGLTKPKYVYVKNGIESGVKICKDGSKIKIYSFKNKLYPNNSK